MHFLNWSASTGSATASWAWRLPEMAIEDNLRAIAEPIRNHSSAILTVEAVNYQ